MVASSLSQKFKLEMVFDVKRLDGLLAEHGKTFRLNRAVPWTGLPIIAHLFRMLPRRQRKQQISSRRMHIRFVHGSQSIQLRRA